MVDQNGKPLVDEGFLK
ncbi:hypothetical protein SPD48_11140 [Pseudogracilibacillus sp. SE30717A]